MKALTNLWVLALAAFTTLSCTKQEDTSTLILPRLSMAKLAAVAAATKPAPYDVLHLGSNWKLSVPIDVDGGNTGTATTISNSKLADGYNSDYFYTLDSPYTDVVRLWCPVNGATTSPGSGSDHPRVELNELTNWYTKNQSGISDEIIGGRMDVVLSVRQFSATGDVIIGQIHGTGTPAGSYPFVMLHASNDSIVAVVKGDTVGNTGTKKYTLLRNVTLGAKITFSIVDSTNGHIYFTASSTGATGKGSWSTAVPANWKTVLVRFQVGNYLQDHDLSAVSTSGSKVNLYSLKVTH